MGASQGQSGDEGARRSVEVEARTIDEAIARGLVRLGGLSRSEVEIEILSEGRAGLLGFGGMPVRVRLTERAREEAGEGGERAARPELARVKAPGAGRTRAIAPGAGGGEGTGRAAVAADAMTAEEQAEAARVAQEVVGHMLELLGYGQVTFEVRESLLPPGLEDRGSLVLSLRGGGTERLLADDARPLKALQFLARLVLCRRLGHWTNLLLDVGDDRARRMRELCQLAEQSASLVEREGRPVSLPPMSAYERRVVHLVLRDHANVTTQSIGEGEHRKVTVRRKDQLLPEV